MTGDEIRTAFLEFFQERGHMIVPSSSLIPAADPTLLLTSAGMVQFKPYFTGEMKPPQRRLTSAQKCFRTTDIDAVGDLNHLTFFEMLGNFSVGEYFKEEAISYAWEFITECLKLPQDRLWITVYLEDDEAFDMWRRIGLPEERISRWGEKENYWGPAGTEGPCGPCSEIHYDYGEEYSCGKPTCGPNCTCGRFVELWNLVFMQFYQDQDGLRSPLPAPNIDTGLGLERATAILQGRLTPYETDLFSGLIGHIEDVTNRKYGRDNETDVAMRVVAEHSRSATFLITDGVVPGNEGRSYVLRRLIRRGIRFGRKLGFSAENGFLGQLAEIVISTMGAQYPELLEHRRFVVRVLRIEEEKFAITFERGNGILAGMMKFRQQHVTNLSKVRAFLKANAEDLESVIELIKDLTDHNAFKDEGEANGADIAFASLTGVLETASPKGRARLLAAWLARITGIEAFTLYDTYGFPLELTQEMAGEHGLKVDVESFQGEMSLQRERGRAGHRFGGEFDWLKLVETLGGGATRFLGYETLETDSVVLGFIKNGSIVDSVTTGDEIQVVLRDTAFYPEGGGQIGDTGVVEGPTGTLRVRDTQSPLVDLIVHEGVVEQGVMNLGDSVQLSVNPSNRLSAGRNHTATHLLHSALRKVLGKHVRQAGSLVAPDRLRFDFTHVTALSRKELLEVQRIVNEKIRQDLPIVRQETTYREAISRGALAFFGDKYGNRVQMVEISEGSVPFSTEVCGGTHMQRTGEVGYFHVVSEGSIGAGLRRIEAATGRFAEETMQRYLDALNESARLLEVSPEQLPVRVGVLKQELENDRRRLAEHERDNSRQNATELLNKVKQVEGINLLVSRVESSRLGDLREMGDWVRDKLGTGILALGGIFEDRPVVVVMVTSDLVKIGYHAGNLARQIAKLMGGGGGGQPGMAQAGGKRKEDLDKALAAATDLIRDMKVSL